MTSHNPHDYEVSSREYLEDIDEQASLETWTVGEDELQISVIIYHMTGISFTCNDWQGQQPQSVDEIQDYAWISFDGQPSIMMDGLPVLMA